MGAPLKYKPHQMVQALNETRGMIYLAAERLGCEADTIYSYAKRYASVKEAITRHRGRTTDIAELKLYQAITEGEPWAVQFYLKTQGRDRGYVEKIDVTIQVQQAVAKVAKEFDMTPEDLLAEAQSFILEERNAS
jgi:hypothetical protein